MVGQPISPSTILYQVLRWSVYEDTVSKMRYIGARRCSHMPNIICKYKMPVSNVCNNT